MAKKKKKLSEIRDALLNNTSFIKNEEKPVEVQTVVETVVEKVIETVIPDNAIVIDKSVLSKMNMLSRFYEKETTELINEALSHYLRLKRLDLDEALKNMVIGDDEE